MREWKDEDGSLCYEPDCVDEWLKDIRTIGFDYDGCNTVESLKELIDELLEMALQARKCLWNNKLFGIYGSPKDIKVFKM